MWRSSEILSQNVKITGSLQVLFEFEYLQVRSKQPNATNFIVNTGGMERSAMILATSETGGPTEGDDGGVPQGQKKVRQKEKYRLLLAKMEKRVEKKKKTSHWGLWGKEGKDASAKRAPNRPLSPGLSPSPPHLGIFCEGMAEASSGEIQRTRGVRRPEVTIRIFWSSMEISSGMHLDEFMINFSLERR
ncbi:hypothetical protein CBS147326_5726 [Penicillium roqueforti]|nr:hypothetical protein CBS147326_5726 [Penicillium roqueforti]